MSDSSTGIVTTGLGVTTALGRGVGALRDALYSGRDGIRPIEHFDTTPFGPYVLGACIGDNDPLRWAREAALERPDAGTGPALGVRQRLRALERRLARDLGNTRTECSRSATIAEHRDAVSRWGTRRGRQGPLL